MWQAARNKVLDGEWQKTKLKTMADDLAANLTMVLESQFELIGATTVQGDQDPFRFWEQRAKDLSAIFQRAMLLTGKLRAAPD